MSGSSGGSIGGGFAPEPTCEKILIRTQLASPRAEVIDELSVGDILDVVFTVPTGPLTAQTYDGDIAGAILISDPASLIKCINEGFDFKAKVLAITGGDCQVSIYCAGR
ncbi:hypothetical protein GWR56_06620 [Mucilaginibacter sp. 14171R-50]|uniref:hypothetical protein n=1 Tax=Mucilaginibacter sp. 14171R-50 TaxID=2703789 RepID=UPI00138C2632|nr:hypothetical protein [Mucilaginibacter sp. 14171R-50]QHS55228.1 hypothetical protein GWR56_06620 [Mucilaginibacter sp. 14171R-50]